MSNKKLKDRIKVLESSIRLLCDSISQTNGNLSKLCEILLNNEEETLKLTISNNAMEYHIKDCNYNPTYFNT